MERDRNVETAVRMPGKEEERQKFRKTRAKSSRFLDNYYNPHLHPKFWISNGAYIIKRNYEYSKTGLSHYFEKQNVLYKLNVEEKEKKTKEIIRNFVEFEYMDDNEIIIIIEHCANCEDHQTHTQHSSDIYRNFAKSIQSAIILRFPFIKVYLKAIDTDIIINDDKNEKAGKIIDEKYKQVRIGAMEVLLCKKIAGKKESFELFSKLQSHQWPSISKLLDTIIQYVPCFNLNINIFDKENGILEFNKEYEEGKDKEDDYSYSKFEQIKVNVYYLNNEKIKEICRTAADEVENFLNPKKKLTMIRTVNNTKMNETNSKLKSDLDMTNSKISKKIFSDRPNTVFPKTLRPLTGFSTNPLEENSKFSKQNYTNTNARPYSTNTLFGTNLNRSNYNIRERENVEIEDKDIIDCLKGDLIRSFFTSKKGWVNLDSLPYDTYLIEVEESKNFLVSASILKLHKIMESNTIKKFFGLRRQTHCYIDLYLYFNSKVNDADNMILIEGGEVYLKKINESNLVYVEDDAENKFTLKENKKFKGRYQQIITPGKYLIEVKKPGYEIFLKEFDLTPGEKKVNIELVKEKSYKLKVTALNYENFTVLDSVHLKLLLPNNDNISEGLTDSTGVYVFETSKKDEYLTVVAQKQGFFLSQRSFIKDNSSTNTKNNTQQTDKNDQQSSGEKPSSENQVEVQKEIVVVLVRETLVTMEKSILFITYSNCFNENFDPLFLYSDKMSELLEIQCSNLQKEVGILTTQFKCKTTIKSVNDENYNFTDFEEICRLILKIKNPDMLKTYEITFKSSMNGLQKLNCECAVYTMNSVFFVQPPQFSREQKFEYWDVGFLDYKNHLFFELGQLLTAPFEKDTFFFNEWMVFLEKIINKKNYLKLFELFEFNKGNLSFNDRTVYEPPFLKCLRNFLGENENSVDFLIYFCDLMKLNNGMVSFSLLKRKILSNLKNFKEIKANLSG